MPTTYETGLLQAKAYRILKTVVTQSLEEYQLSTTEWALIGYVFKNKQMRSSDIAGLLGVEAPLVTHHINALEARGILARQPDPTDQRAKIIILTNDGKKMVPRIEQDVKAATKQLLGKNGVRDLLGYVRVLQSIVDSHDSRKKM